MSVSLQVSNLHKNVVKMVKVILVIFDFGNAVIAHYI